MLLCSVVKNLRFADEYLSTEILPLLTAEIQSIDNQANIIEKTASA